jgi:Prp8 binding protein
MDNTLKIWDVKPFAPASRLVRSLEGAPQGFEKNLIKCCWEGKGEFVASGSADRSVTVWEVATGKIVYKVRATKWTRRREGTRGATEHLSDCVSFSYSSLCSNQLPGHKGVVNEVSFSPIEPILVSCSSDRTLFLGEVDPEDVVRRR